MKSRLALNLALTYSKTRFERGRWTDSASAEADSGEECPCGAQPV